MSGRAGAIASWSVRMWARELARVFHTGTRSVVIGAVAALLAAAALGGVLATLTWSQLGGGLPAEIARPVLTTAFAGAAVTAAAVAVVAAVSAPSRTALQSLLDMLPVGRTPARVGQLLPVCGAALAYAIVLTTTTVVVILAVTTSPGAAVLGIVLHLVALVLVQVLCVGVFVLMSSGLSRWLRLPQQYATVLAAAAVLATVLVVAGADIVAAGTAPPAVLDGAPHRVLAAVVAGEGGAREGIVLLVWVAAAAAAVGLSGARGPRQPAPRPITLLRGLPAPRSPRGGLIRLELIAGVRTPQLFVMGAASAAALALAWWAAQGAFAPFAPAVAGAAVSLPCFLSAYAVGRTRRIRWIGRMLGAGLYAWAGPTAVAYGLIGAAIGLPALVVALATGLVPAGDVPQVLARALVALLAGLLGGALVPYSEEQPLASAVTGFTVGVLYLAASLATQGVASVTGPAGVPLTALALAALLALGYFAAARTQDAHAVDRG